VEVRRLIQRGKTEDRAEQKPPARVGTPGRAQAQAGERQRDGAEQQHGGGEPSRDVPLARGIEQRREPVQVPVAVLEAHVEDEQAGGGQRHDHEQAGSRHSARREVVPLIGAFHPSNVSGGREVKLRAP
jgi:hypothetical protein